MERRREPARRRSLVVVAGAPPGQRGARLPRAVPGGAVHVHRRSGHRGHSQPQPGNESSWSGELGATVPRVGTSLDAALFWSEYQNLIEPELVTGGTEIQFTNVTRARVRGLDLTARAADLVHGHLTATLAYTWLDARDLTRPAAGVPAAAPGHAERRLARRPRPAPER